MGVTLKSVNMAKRMHAYFCWMLLVVFCVHMTNGQCFRGKIIQYRCAKNNISDVPMVGADVIVMPGGGRLLIPATLTEVQAVICPRCPCSSVLPGNFFVISLKV